MKRVVIIVPDTVTHSISNFKQIHKQQLPVTAGTMVQALAANSYDENYYFSRESVRVVSIEDITQ